MRNTDYMDWNEIIGHEDNTLVLKAMLSAKKTPHALLFTGSSGVGKKLTAKTFAAALLCGSEKENAPCGSCLSCRHYKLKQHPDFKTVLPEETASTIKINQIRELKRFALLSPALDQGRVCVIENAETMTREAANSLLKLLEEPPPDFHFILTADSNRPLISTITSRCRKINFCPLTPSILAQNLVQKKISYSEVSTEKIFAAANLSGGRVGKALEFLQPDGFLLRDRAAEYIKLLSDGSIEMSGEFLNNLGTLKQQEAQMLLEYAGSIIRDTLLLVINNKNIALKNNYNNNLSSNLSSILFNPDLIELLNSLSQSWNETSLPVAHKSLRETIRALSGNANIRLAIDSLTIKLKRLTERGELVW